MYGGIPRGDGADLGIQISNNGQIKELSAVLFGKDGIVSEHRGFIKLAIAYKRR